MAYNYPTYRFNRAGAQVRVENEQEDRKLGGEWFDHPPTETSEPISFEEEDDTDDIEDPVDDDVDDMIANEEDDTDDKKKKKSHARTTARKK